MYNVYAAETRTVLGDGFIGLRFPQTPAVRCIYANCFFFFFPPSNDDQPQRCNEIMADE